MIHTVLPSSQPTDPRTATREQRMERGGPLHLLIISHDVVGSRMAGPGIRCWEMARVLSAQQPVTLIAPQPIDRPLALDLYDPVLLENLELFRAAPERQRTAQYEADQSLLAQELAAGDFL